MVQHAWLLRKGSHPIYLIEVLPCCVLHCNLSLSTALQRREGYAAPSANRLPLASIWDPAGKLNLQAAAG